MRPQGDTAGEIMPTVRSSPAMDEISEVISYF
jgi:hypothetical protein